MSEKAGYSKAGQLNVAVVGMGWWGKALVGQIKQSDKLRVVKAVDVAPAAEEWARSQGIECTKEFNAVLADPDIGGVILCTPHTQHCDQVVAAARAKKHVFCEKPLAMSRREILAEVEACKANGVVLAVGHEHRFKPPFIELLRTVRSGELGAIQITEVTFSHELKPHAPDNWRIQKAEAPGGPSMTALGIHGLDLCIGVNGPVESVVASTASIITKMDETLAALIRFKSGACGVISSLFGSPFTIRFAVYGSKGWVEIHDKTHPQAPTGWIVKQGKHGAPFETTEAPASPLVRANLEAFADAAAGHAPYPVTQDEMIANISAFEAICKSAETGKPVTVEG